MHRSIVLILLRLLGAEAGGEAANDEWAPAKPKSAPTGDPSRSPATSVTLQVSHCPVRQSCGSTIPPASAAFTRVSPSLALIVLPLIVKEADI